MNHRGITLLSVLGAAVISAACGSTDASISTKVKTNLTADDTVKTAQIDVGVQKKVVTLSGAVDTQAVKDQAVAVARRTDGVADVVDQTTIKEQSSSPDLGAGHGGDMMDRGMKMGEKGMKMGDKEHTKDGKHE